MWITSGSERVKFFSIFLYVLYLHRYLHYTSYTMLTLHQLALLTIHILQYIYTGQIELQLIYLHYCLSH